MPKQTTLSDYHAMQAGELYADRDQAEPAPERDPFSGLMAEARGRLAALRVEDHCTAEMSLSMIRGRVMEAAIGLDPAPTDQETQDEAERIWASFTDNRTGPSARPAATTRQAEAIVAAVTGVTSVLRVPSEAEFGEDDLFVSTALAARADILAARHDELEHLTRGEYRVVYLWKKAGGKSKGRGVFGKTTKTSGALKLFAEATWVIWLAADHCRAVGYGDREIEALLFHEMLHTGVAEPDEETGRGGGPTMIPHDVEEFRRVIEVYGLWDAGLREVAPAFKRPGGQMGLFDASDDGQEEDAEIGEAMERARLGEDGQEEDDADFEAMERARLGEDAREEDAEPEGDPLADVEPVI